MYFFQGSNLDRGATAADYRIFLESSECPEVDLLTNIVSCKPPKKAPRVIRTGAYEEDKIRIQVKKHVKNCNVSF